MTLLWLVRSLDNRLGGSGVQAGLGHHQLMTDAGWLVAGVTSPTVDSRTSSVWVAVVHQMVREIGGSVVGCVEPPGPGRNYYRLAAVLPGVGRVWVLLNAAIPLVGCQQRAEPGDLALPFRDVQRPDLFEVAGLRVATSDELERALRSSDLVGLRPDEMRDIEYHRPGRVGDVIYNWFD
jgi:hypothetical protein